MTFADLVETARRFWKQGKLTPVSTSFLMHAHERGSRSAQALDELAIDLRDEGIALWASNPAQIVEAIVKVEQSWGLQQTPETAIQLGVMYDLVNRHQDALTVYRQAFHRFPDHPRLRHEAGITLLRHGQPADVRDFVDSVLRHDPDDAFARFVSEMLAAYPSWVKRLAAAIEAGPKDRSAFLLTCAVWGEPFTTNFIQYLCATLLSPDNLPALAEHHAIHFAIFTTAENEMWMKTDPIFMQLAAYASIHFIHYEPHWVRYSAPMNQHYGAELGPYYARTCKFLMFSCAHYVAQAAGRGLDCAVVNLCADMIFDDRILTTLADLMTRNDVVGFNGFRVNAEFARPTIDRTFRDGRGRVAIPAKEFAELFIGHIPESYFVDSPNFTSFPEIVCWRAGPKAVIVHATHYHPICIRPSALSLPLELSIDPVDSRFLDKRFSDRSRLHLVRDMSIVCLALEEVAGFDHTPAEPRAMSVQELGRWLWQVWGPWRATKFELPLCISAGPLPPQWDTVRKEAQATAAQVIKVAEAFEEGNRGRKTWKLPATSTSP